METPTGDITQDENGTWRDAEGRVCVEETCEDGGGTGAFVLANDADTCPDGIPIHQTPPAPRASQIDSTEAALRARVAATHAGDTASGWDNWPSEYVTDSGEFEGGC